jgi:hypothetical protein
MTKQLRRDPMPMSSGGLCNRVEAIVKFASRKGGCKCPGVGIQFRLSEGRRCISDAAGRYNTERTEDFLTAANCARRWQAV